MAVNKITLLSNQLPTFTENLYSEFAGKFGAAVSETDIFSKMDKNDFHCTIVCKKNDSDPVVFSYIGDNKFVSGKAPTQFFYYIKDVDGFNDGTYWFSDEDITEGTFTIEFTFSAPTVFQVGTTGESVVDAIHKALRAGDTEPKSNNIMEALDEKSNTAYIDSNVVHNIEDIFKYDAGDLAWVKGEKV